MASIRNLAGAAALLVAASFVAGGSAPARAAERGEALYELCARCHGSDGVGDRELGAPAIAGMSEWYVRGQLVKFRDGLRGTHPDDFEGMRMRPMSLTLLKQGDLEAVAAFVAGMTALAPEASLEGGDATKGEVLYAPCIACHGADGGGNEALQGAPLARTSDWYLYRSIEKFKSGIRGANPKDPMATLMRPMAMTLADDQAVKDVIAHIMTLAK